MLDGSRGNGNRDTPLAGQDFAPFPDGDAQFSEMTSKSWFRRLREALSGILTGALLLLASVVLLFWNEGRAVMTANALHEGAGQVVEANIRTIDRSLEGKLIHVSGPLRIATPPQDSELGVSTASARLDRRVEMYQWRENKTSKTEKTLGGGEETVTTYSYERVWSDGEHRSDGFRRPQGHANPAFPLKSKTFVAAARLGVYDLAAERAGGIGTREPLALDSRQAAVIGARLGLPASVMDGKAFVGRDPANPQVGDLHVSYFAAKADQASVVAAQKGSELAPYTTSNGRAIFLSREGLVAAPAMFENALQGNALMTWLARVGGLVLAIAGFRLILRIAGVIADVVPFFGDIVAAGAGLIATLLGASLATLVAGAAWVYYRPLVGLGLLAIAAVAIALVLKRTRDAAGQAAQRAPA